jgi:hypothetical protein
VSNRRKLKGSRKTAALSSTATPERPKGQPWNKGLALTTRPSLSTVRRSLEACVAEGIAERSPMHTGKPGRPAIGYRLTEEARRKAEAEESRLPLSIQLEQERRQINAAKRRRAELKQRAARLRKEIERAERVADLAKARREELNDLIEMLMDASTVLDRAGYDPSVLLPEELDALGEYGCVARDGDRLYFTEMWVRTYCDMRGGGAQLVTHPLAAPAR